MSRWYDPDGNITSRACSAATSAVLMRFDTLVILEGNIPKVNRFDVNKYQNFNLPYKYRIMKLSHLSKNPFFLDSVVLASDKSFPYASLFYINLDDLSPLASSQRVAKPFPPAAVLHPERAPHREKTTFLYMSAQIPSLRPGSARFFCLGN